MKRTWLGLLAGFLSTAVLAADPRTMTLAVQEGSGTVEFLAIGKPGFLRINGKSSKTPKGSLEIRGGQVTGEISVDLDSVGTGIALRDRHMREKYLETAKYPAARLKLTGLSLPADFQNPEAEFEVPFKAILEVHGTAAPVAGTAKITRRNERVTVAADFETRIADHKIEKPGYLGVTMADVVKVHCELDVPLKAGK